MRKYEKSLPTSEAVAEKMKEIEQEKLLPEGMKLQVFNQRTDLVHVTTHNVLHNLVVGMAPGDRASCSSSWATWPARGSWRS